MNRKEFQQWLEQFPEETIIEVAIQGEAPMYESYGKVWFEEFKGKNSEDHYFIDFTENAFVKEGDKHYMKKYLQLGSEQ